MISSFKILISYDGNRLLKLSEFMSICVVLHSIYVVF